MNKTSIYLIGIIFFLGLASCQKTDTKSGGFSVPESSDFSWGESKDALKKNLENRGWNLEQESDSQVNFAFPMAGSEEPELLTSGMTALSPFQITGYFSSNRLSAIRMIRRDKNEKIAPFILKVKETYNLNSAAWESEEKATVTDTGNRIREKTVLFETDTVIARLLTSTVDTVESNLDEGMFNEMELMLFSKKENEGINLKAMQMTPDI